MTVYYLFYDEVWEDVVRPPHGTYQKIGVKIKLVKVHVMLMICRIVFNCISHSMVHIFAFISCTLFSHAESCLLLLPRDTQSSFVCPTFLCFK